MDTILVLVPCPNLVRDPNLAKRSRKEALELYKQQCTDEYITNVRTAVVKRFNDIIQQNGTSSREHTNTNIVDFSSYILHEVVDTPITYANQTNVGAGTPFGLSHGLMQLSFMRPPSFFNNIINNRHDQYQHQINPNVLFCGASTRPGNGVPLVLIGAKLIAQQAFDKMMKQLQQQNQKKKK